MKNIKNILFCGLLMLCFVPKIVNADVANLEYHFQKIAKLGDEVTYTFYYGGLDVGEYELFVNYDKEYLELVDSNNGSYYSGACAGSVTTINEMDGKITISHPSGACQGPVELIFKTLKEGKTKLEVTPGENTGFLNQEQIVEDVETEIINTNLECPECEKCVVCEECKECDSTDSMALYVLAGSFLVLALFFLVFTIVISKKKNSK